MRTKDHIPNMSMTAKREEVLEIIRTLGQPTTQDIVDELNRRHVHSWYYADGVRKVCRDLVDLGRIERIDIPSRKKGAIQATYTWRAIEDETAGQHRGLDDRAGPRERP